MEIRNEEKKNELSRRDFIKTTAAVSLAALTTGCLSAPAAQSAGMAAGTSTTRKIRVGLVGCGRRGLGAAKDCIKSSENVELVAVGDLFRDALDAGVAKLKTDLPAGSFAVKPDACFTGFDAYRKVIATDVDLVLLATPPHFRPAHLKAAIDAGKHVFMEKPVAVDPVGVHSIIATSEVAAQKGLAIVAGTQRRHQAHYIEIMRRIHEGAIGEIVSAECYWMGDFEYYKAIPRQAAWSDMEYQIRNWNSYTWLSGDHIVEQHVHNIDVVNWALGAPPVSALGTGGRQARIAPEYGHIFDHFAIEFDYPNGVRVTSICRQQSKCSGRVSERIVGAKGVAYTDGRNGKITGANPFTFEGKAISPYVQEHADLIASIRAGKPLNEGRHVAESTMTAILGRMSAYTGQELNWKWAMNASKLDLTPPKYEFGDLPVPPVAIPGVTPLV